VLVVLVVLLHVALTQPGGDHLCSFQYQKSLEEFGKDPETWKFVILQFSRLNEVNNIIVVVLITCMVSGNV